MPIDYKKTEKQLYQPKTSPGIIDVPEMLFVMADGKGNPNTSAEYANAVQILYGLSYAIKMTKTWAGWFEYVVPPLEGWWNSADKDFKDGPAMIFDKNKFVWTAAIRLPEFVKPDVFAEAKETLNKKKPELDLSLARMENFTDGLCVQVMHIGSYDDEPATVAKMEQFAAEQGYAPDFSDGRRHHEIYLSDPRKMAVEKLRTVIRHPIQKTED
jgi:hypothetical protein